MVQCLSIICVVCTLSSLRVSYGGWPEQKSWYVLKYLAHKTDWDSGTESALVPCSKLSEVKRIGEGERERGREREWENPWEADTERKDRQDQLALSNKAGEERGRERERERE